MFISFRHSIYWSFVELKAVEVGEGEVGEGEVGEMGEGDRKKMSLWM